VEDVLNLSSVILIASWAIGFFALSMGVFIHLFLILAILAIVYKVILGRRMFKTKINFNLINLKPSK
jgi:hypothetical protein